MQTRSKTSIPAMRAKTSNGKPVWYHKGIQIKFHTPAEVKQVEEFGKELARIRKDMTRGLFL